VTTLITAVDSFIGSWLAESFAADGERVIGTTHRDLDICDAAAVAATVRDAAPDVIIHLAARSSVKLSVQDPVATLATNVLGTLHVFDAVRAHAPAARVVSVGSSAEYGPSVPVERLAESHALAPKTPYGVSKAAQGQLAQIYVGAHGVQVIHVRPFAVIGPRKRGDALADFCQNIVRIERDEATELSVGNTGSVRDFVDVRDCAAALRRIAERGEVGTVYNICSGIGTSLDEIIELLRGASRVPFAVVPVASRARKLDDVRLVGDPSRLAALGYAPRYTLDETVRATLDYWRATSSSS
jgi:GDP-4-dehydro-6-deoxy-D-mannose reductase